MANKPEPIQTSPALRDAHREFRKGTWSKPLLLVAIAGGLLGALSLLSMEKPKEEARAAIPLGAQAEPDSFTIGSSQGPDRIPDVPVKESPRRQRRDDQEAAARPSGIVPEKQFAAEFKHKASREARD